MSDNYVCGQFTCRVTFAKNGPIWPRDEGNSYLLPFYNAGQREISADSVLEAKHQIGRRLGCRSRGATQKTFWDVPST